MTSHWPEHLRVVRHPLGPLLLKVLTWMLIALVIDHYAANWIEQIRFDASPGRFRRDAWLGIEVLGLAFACALAIVWQIGRPMRQAVQAAADAVRRCDEAIGEYQQFERDRALTIAGLAHDLRAPLTRLRARAEVVLDTQTADAFIRDADLLSHIINRFLDFSRLSVDQGPPVPVDTYCRAHWGPIEYRGTRSAEMHFDCDAGEDFRLPAVDIERIVSNLVENAIAYGAGPIEIRTRRIAADAVVDGRDVGYWEFRVRDHGTGIPDAKIETAKQPFVRLDAASGGNGHFGLGLAIVNKLVQERHGTLQLENAVGGGLAVTMRFPA